MLLPDVNVLVYAYREDAPRHQDFRRWDIFARFEGLRWRHPLDG